MQASNVRRFHTVPTLGDQTVGAHSFRVCLVLRHLCGGLVPVLLYEAAMFHDLAESRYGDIPAPVRWEDSELDHKLDKLEQRWLIDHYAYVPLSDRERKVLNIADKLELVLFCTEQLNLGNKNMALVRERGIDYALQQAEDDSELFSRVTEFIKECDNVRQ